MAFSKFKALLKKAAARTIEDLWDAIAQALPQLTPNDCANYFAAAIEPRRLLPTITATL